MKIDAYMQVNQVYNTNKTKKMEKANVHSASDKLEISDFGKDFHIAKQVTKEAPEVREDKVQMFKEQLQAGTYNVSAEDIAEKLVDRLIG